MCWLIVFFLGCVSEKEPPECITYYDTCNAGCDLQCGTTDEKEIVEKQDSCDLGCLQDTAFVPDECILVDNTCQWIEE